MAFRTDDFSKHDKDSNSHLYQEISKDEEPGPCWTHLVDDASPRLGSTLTSRTCFCTSDLPLKLRERGEKGGSNQVFSKFYTTSWDKYSNILILHYKETISPEPYSIQL